MQAEQAGGIGAVEDIEIGARPRIHLEDVEVVAIDDEIEAVEADEAELARQAVERRGNGSGDALADRGRLQQAAEAKRFRGDDHCSLKPSSSALRPSARNDAPIARPATRRWK